nr:hypothetical protein [Tanacetum cinerariifolium]
YVTDSDPEENSKDGPVDYPVDGGDDDDDDDDDEEEEVEVSDDEEEHGVRSTLYKKEETQKQPDIKSHPLENPQLSAEIRSVTTDLVRSVVTSIFVDLEHDTQLEMDNNRRRNP